MDQSALIAAIADRTAGEQHLLGLFLGGSYGRSTADAFSDVDLIALVETQHHQLFAEQWRTILDSLAPVVFWSERRGAGVLLNAITETWLRCDLSILQPTELVGHARTTVKPLLDRRAFYGGLPEYLPAKTPDRERVRLLVHEFIRVLGLLPVVVGRHEYLTAVGGAAMLRDHLTNLMLEDIALPDRGGALHLSRLLSQEDMKCLTSLPFPKPTREDVISAHIAAAREFFPRARDLYHRLGLEWPEAFELATRRHLHKQLNVNIDC